MVNLNTLPRICVVVVFGYSATVTSTEVAQEKPRKESLDSGFFHKNDKPSTELPEVEESPMCSVEWYLLPKPENRVCLLEKLPFDVAKDVPWDCDEPIEPSLEKRIRKFFSLRGLIFTSMSSYPGLDEINNVGQTTQGSLDGSFSSKEDEPSSKSQEVPEPENMDSQEETDTAGPPKFSVEWYLLPKPENRKHLRNELPFDLAVALPEDCNEPILPVVEKRIRKFFSLSGKNQRLLRVHSYCWIG
ncbi:SmORF protein [Babesia bovis T2Bo]|uniref:SmORF n=1 Tax=Babesia bovis TaxID=5865 RepID=A7AWP2_BABBO|nr:SmORF protein [Babesia bovis T2Bo]EDO05470.1 SmORF protein [Babesia bovis T2Bo]|eukprot:XP_001609038.1 SmORF [Babesia bovis T2Bo]